MSHFFTTEGTEITEKRLIVFENVIIRRYDLNVKKEKAKPFSFAFLEIGVCSDEFMV